MADDWGKTEAIGPNYTDRGASLRTMLVLYNHSAGRGTIIMVFRKSRNVNTDYRSENGSGHYD